ncbi:methyl-accepting chemotaxis protein [Moritella sp. 24]|uniref:methyl-accepting chemotaxis protein n=1 Tax=Moritella sp. 24 TaxID=2746230 RepID=UPI001BA56227|nr:methyl-accepting chemotaxis protein [Moritella sp. 24]QUM76789.1 methyl-accepting chemotaxis protein [Moritella sp. 24]
MDFLTSFKGRIISVVILLLITSLTIASFISYKQLSTSMVESIDQYSELKVESTTDKITDWFVTIENGLAKTAPSFATTRDNQQTLRMVRQVANATQATDIIAGYEDGRTFSALDGQVPLSAFDARTSAWYKAAKLNRTTSITDIYKHSISGELIISIAEPFYENGQLKGVLLADINLNMLKEMVSKSAFFGATTSLYDINRMTIASTDKRENIGKEMQRYNKRYAALQTQIFQNDTGTFEFKADGKNQIVYYKTLQLDDKSSWKIAITIDKSVHFAPVSRGLNNAIISNALLVIIASLIIFVSLSRLYRPILALKATILDLAKGDADLTRRLDVNSRDDLGQIAESVNAFVSNLQRMMLEISDSTEHISMGIEQLKAQTEQNNAVLIDHASETDQVVVAVTEMSSTADSVAQSAAQSATFTQHSADEAHQSKAVVEGAVHGVADLVNEVEAMALNIQTMNEDTHKISKVLSVIGEIADQTNLLALNAAIEAARAGEQGRGFAVVADEVRTLAARTQQSTSEINEMLARLRNGADMVVRAMDITKASCQQTAQTTASVNDNLDSMTSSVMQINDLGIQIATAAEEQSSVTEEINRNMTMIQSMVNQLTENGEKTMDSTRNLASSNEQLLTIVDKFKLK